MYKVFIVLFFISALLACNQSDDQSPMTSDLHQLENNWMHAVMKKDKEVLDRVVAPEFTVTGMKYIDSAAVTRSVWMNNVMQDLAIDSVQFIKTKVSTIENIGIVRAQFYWSGTYGKDRFADTTSFVDTWIRRNGDWRVISRIVTD